jgi:hypothetical protein
VQFETKTFRTAQNAQVFFNRTGNRLIDRLARNVFGKSDTKRRFAGYKGGEVAVILINHGSKPFAIARGDRIAQGIIAAAPQADLVEVASLGATERGAGGFGSTGSH